MLSEALDNYWGDTETNRREYPRYSCNKTAVIEQGNDQIRGTVKEVSKNGMCLQTPTPLKEARLTHVKFSPQENTPRKIGGIIRWNAKISNSAYESGLEITRKE